jgi:hypothetical protein
VIELIDERLKSAPIELHGEYIMCADAAKMLGYHLEHIWRLCRTGKIKSAIKIVSDWLILYDEVAAMRQKVQPKRRQHSIIIDGDKLEIAGKPKTADDAPTLPSRDEMLAAGIILPLDGLYQTPTTVAKTMGCNQARVLSVCRQRQGKGIIKLSIGFLIPASEIISLCLALLNAE